MHDLGCFSNNVDAPPPPTTSSDCTGLRPNIFPRFLSSTRLSAVRAPLPTPIFAVMLPLFHFPVSFLSSRAHCHKHSTDDRRSPNSSSCFLAKTRVNFFRLPFQFERALELIAFPLFGYRSSWPAYLLRRRVAALSPLPIPFPLPHLLKIQ